MQKTVNVMPYFFKYMESVYNVPHEWFEEYIPSPGLERLVNDFGRIRQEKRKGQPVDVIYFTGFGKQIEVAMDRNDPTNLTNVFEKYTSTRYANDFASGICIRVGSTTRDRASRMLHGIDEMSPNIRLKEGDNSWNDIELQLYARRQRKRKMSEGIEIV